MTERNFGARKPVCTHRAELCGFTKAMNQYSEAGLLRKVLKEEALSG